MIFVIGFLSINYNYLKMLINEPTSISLTVPEHSITQDSTKTIKLNITNSLLYFLNDEQIHHEDIKSKLLKAIESTDNKDSGVILQAEKGVPVKRIVEVMEIANENDFKIILAVKPN